MSNKTKILILLIAGLFLGSCKTMNLPDAYNVTYTKKRVNPYGCWIKAKLDNMAEINGELIWMNQDSIFILEKDNFIGCISIGSVKEAQLYTHRNMSNKYLLLTSFYLIPNFIGGAADFEYGGGLLAIGIPLAVVGLSTVLIESGFQRNILKYPKRQSLGEMKKFARYPGDKPVNVDFNNLTLKPVKNKKN